MAARTWRAHGIVYIGSIWLYYRCHPECPQRRPTRDSAARAPFGRQRQALALLNDLLSLLSITGWLPCMMPSQRLGGCTR
jgi:hypothetical protein